MHVEFLVEEESIEVALQSLVPAVAGPTVTFNVHPHQGKPDLMAKLPDRLRGYASWLPSDWRIAILVDEDRQDCRALKRKLEAAARSAGLRSQSRPDRSGRFRVLNRIVIEELEAWFFGDIDALVSAYPRVPPTLHKKAPYRDPDAIAGGTWEALERVLQEVGYHSGGLMKIAAARAIAPHMSPARNRSRSFQHFIQALAALLA